MFKYLATFSFLPSRMVHKQKERSLETSLIFDTEEIVKGSKNHLEKAKISVDSEVKKEAMVALKGHLPEINAALKALGDDFDWRQGNEFIARALGFEGKSKAYIAAAVKGIQEYAFQKLDLMADRLAKVDGKFGSYSRGALILAEQLDVDFSLKGRRVAALEAEAILAREKKELKQQEKVVFSAYAAQNVLGDRMNDYTFSLIKTPLMTKVNLKKIEDPNYLLGLLYQIKHDGSDEQRFFDMVLSAAEKKKAKAYAELFLTPASTTPPETLVS